MSFLHPLQVVAAVLTEWVRHEQEKVIEFLQTETEVLLEQLGDKRILLSDDDRRLSATVANPLHLIFTGRLLDRHARNWCAHGKR